MSDGTFDCLCARCLSPNTIKVNTAHLSITQWFICGKCKASNVANCKVKLAAEEFKPTEVQTGRVYYA